MWNPVGLIRPETNLRVGRMAAGVSSLTGRGEITITVGVYRHAFGASLGR